MNRNDKELGERRPETGEQRALPAETPPVSAFRSQLSQRASSLVTTLLVLVVLSTIVVAFLQSMSVERNVARSVANKFRAEQAALSGLQVATELLAAGIGTNFGYVTISTNINTNLAPILVIADGKNRRRLMPLVSGPFSNVMPNGATNANQFDAFLSALTNTNNAVSGNVNRKLGDYSLITDEAGAPRFNAQWIYLTNSAGQTNARFGFFVIDEQAKLNLAVHGTDSDTNRIGWKQSPGKIPVSIPGNPSFISPSSVQTNASNFAFAGLAGIGQAFSSRQEFESKKHLYSLNTISSASIIPDGRVTNTNGAFLQFADAHKPKYNINDLATNTAFGATATDRATNLAAIINSNLPAFKTRDVAFVADGKASNQIRYVERIAASIVDYVDTDSESTALADGEPAGKELAPVITSIAEKYNWVSETGSGSSWENKIVHTTYVQLWNPYQTNVSGNFSFHLFTPNEASRFRFIEMPGAVQSPMEDVRGTNTVSLRPNEFVVYEAGKATNIVVSSVQASLNQTNFPQMSETASTNILKPLHTRYRAYWNGALFDDTPNSSQFYTNTGPGLYKSPVGGSSSTRISLNGPNRFSINYPQYGYCDTNTAKGYRAVGDPRQNYLANYVWKTLAQTNNDVRWNGRNNDNDVTRQDYSVTWMARDYMRTNPPVGIFTGNSDPTSASATWTSGDMTNAIAQIQNAPMTSIGELGNIYDPVQLNDVGFATKGGEPDSWYASGGGRTLRIGQAEFDYPGSPSPSSGTEKKAPSWNIDDLRAVTLLDLFTAIPTNSQGIPELVGKVNLNTAHRDVLAALFSGLGQNGDLAFTNSRLTTNAAYALADSIISNRPYYRLGEVYRFATNLLASTNFSPALGAVTTNVASIMDPGREQVLGALLENLDVRSQAYQVYVIGEALDMRGKVVSQSVLRALVAVKIGRSSPSAPLSATIQPIHVQTY